MTRRDCRRPFADVRAAIVALAAVTATSPAQVEWKPSPYLENRAGHSVASDHAGGGVLLFGGFGTATSADLADTWRWDGTAWTRLAPATSPPARTSPACVADTARQRIVMFGGGDRAAAMDDTWEWDGARWIERTPLASRPSARELHAMAFDARRGRVVLFGGGLRRASGSGFRATGGTWEWDGVRWLQRRPATQPSARYGHAMAYDATSQRVVMFGGIGPGYLGDTWEWDGFDWRQRAPSASPSPRWGHAMVEDPSGHRVLLAGGRDHGLQYLDDLWSWDGTQWTRVATPRPLPARAFHSLAWDDAHGVAVAFGGLRMLGRTSDTWCWDGRAWSLACAGSAPSEAAALGSWDPVRGRVAVFNGTTDVGQPSEQWEWDGRAWQQLFPATMPGARLSAGIVTDSARRRIVMFGGATRGGLVADTWEWDGTTWVDRAPVTQPPVRSGHALAYDAARARVVLFGGRDPGGAAFSDTWEWDGTDWVERLPLATPPGRSAHAMAFDASRGRVVLFGGMADGLGYASDTWEWDGARWRAAAPATRPPGRSAHGLVYDQARRRTVLYGGFLFTGTGNTYYADSWEWDGIDWVERTPLTAPAARQFAVLAYDPVRAVTVLFGGLKEVGGPASDTWEYGPVHPARAVAFGQGCAGSSGVPALTIEPGSGPWLGEDFALELRDLPRAPFALVFVGTSRTVMPPFTLPLELTFVGMPGCSLLVSTEVVTPVLSVGGRARWSVRVPSDRAVLGAIVRAQALAVDPGANRLGATLTNAIEAVVGAK